MISHEEAVRIANSGQGAIVSELRRLSAEASQAIDDAKRREEALEEALNRISDLEIANGEQSKTGGELR